jgi:A/G-specific adenine glycosylase
MLWRVAEEILPAKSCGDFNSALMELGATVCTPRSPKCLVCPVRRYCRAAEAGLQETIPRSRQRRASPLLARWTICISMGERWLIERRPDKGRWAGLWQFPTIEACDAEADAAVVGKKVGLPIRGLRQIGEVRHLLTHRRYVFSVFAATGVSRGKKQPEPVRRWVRLGELTQYPLSRPQVKISEMIAGL